MGGAQWWHGWQGDIVLGSYRLWGHCQAGGLQLFASLKDLGSSPLGSPSCGALWGWS